MSGEVRKQEADGREVYERSQTARGDWLLR